MSKTSEHDKVPPPQLDEYGNPIMVENDSNTETSTTPTVKELLKKLEKLNAKLKKLKTKDKKGKNYSSSSEDDDSSFEEEVSNKARRERKKCDKSSYNAMFLNYDNMPSSTAYIFIHVGKTPFFMGLTIINGSID
jgi:hypothetical protein